MIREELEFRIARYADGDLTLAERQAVEAELAADAEAQALLAEYQTLRSAIEEAAGPALPKVHWDRLEQLLTAAVAGSASPGGPGIKSGGGAESGEADARDVCGRQVGTGAEAEGTAPFAGALGIENEFAIACYADGSLSQEGRGEVEQLLASDARARSLLDEYSDLDATTKAVAYGEALPAVRWEALARHIGSVVDAGANAVLPEDLERQIAEFAGGALPAGDWQAGDWPAGDRPAGDRQAGDWPAGDWPAGDWPAGDWDAVEARLAVEPAARVLAAEYANLEAVLRAAPATLPVPAVDWERFAARISAAVDRETVQSAVRSRKSSNGSFSLLKWLRSPTRMALAASVLIGVALVAKMIHTGPAPVPTPGPVAAKPLPRVEEIAALKPEQPAGPSVSDISIGPPPVARGDSNDDVAIETDDDNVVARPPRAFVASGRTMTHDSEVLSAMPY